MKLIYAISLFLAYHSLLASDQSDIYKLRYDTKLKNHYVENFNGKVLNPSLPSGANVYSRLENFSKIFLKGESTNATIEVSILKGCSSGVMTTEKLLDNVDNVKRCFSDSDLKRIKDLGRSFSLVGVKATSAGLPIQLNGEQIGAIEGTKVKYYSKYCVDTVKCKLKEIPVTAADYPIGREIKTESRDGVLVIVGSTANSDEVCVFENVPHTFQSLGVLCNNRGSNTPKFNQGQCQWITKENTPTGRSKCLPNDPQCSGLVTCNGNKNIATHTATCSIECGQANDLSACTLAEFK